VKVITARNVNEALLLGLNALKIHGVTRPSRNGKVQVFPMPVTTHYKKPNERVIFFPERDANPYFHFMESLWMIAGRRDVEFPAYFSSNIANYSDDGLTFHGAYGYRWRNHFQIPEQPDHVIDQLATIAAALNKNADDRRVVLQMWDTTVDLGLEGKDFPCNLMATFRINPYGKLDMTVFNRSNDMIWGAYGANAVHFSMLHELMAAWVKVPLGSYWQVSTNFHAYQDVLDRHTGFENYTPGTDPYYMEKVKPYPLVTGPIEEWFQDLNMFMESGPVIGFKTKFFKNVAVPMLQSWDCWKNREDPNRKSGALRLADQIVASDWRMACMEWLERRT